jgi:hypothetical protein
VSDGWLAGWRNSRHKEVGGNEAPGEPRPPGLPSLIEWYALKILDMAIPTYAFALEEIAQAVSERGHDTPLELSGPTTGNLSGREDSGFSSSTAVAGMPRGTPRNPRCVNMRMPW